MIVAFTDYGLAGPYVGQLHGVLLREAPGVPVVDLMHDVPPFDARGASYLLAALAGRFPEGTVFLAVVDPGVGGERRGAVARVGDRWYVGPDNGLFNTLVRQGQAAEWWDITFEPPGISSSFHGRDIFAPVAAMLAKGEAVPGTPVDHGERVPVEWPEDLPAVVYVDGFGNLLTGQRAATLAGGRVRLGGRAVTRAATFCEVPVGEPFWYENSIGLVEIAVNQGRADRYFGVQVGAPLVFG